MTIVDNQFERGCRATETRAALFTPHCAAVHPLRLANAATGAVIDRGVRIQDRTAVDAIQPHRPTIAGGLWPRRDTAWHTHVTPQRRTIKGAEDR